MKFDPIYLHLYSASTSHATLLAFRGEDWGFVGIRAFVGGVRAFARKVSTMLSWRGIRGGGFRAFVARVSGFREEGFGFWWGGF